MKIMIDQKNKVIQGMFKKKELKKHFESFEKLFDNRVTLNQIKIKNLLEG